MNEVTQAAAGLTTFGFSMILAWGLIWGAVCGSIAKSKGHNRVTAFFMGLFFSWIAVIVYALMGKTPKKMAEEEVERDRIKKELQRED